eukprot:3836912-Rhodomonas_salina.2
MPRKQFCTLLPAKRSVNACQKESCCALSHCQTCVNNSDAELVTTSFGEILVFCAPSGMCWWALTCEMVWVQRFE